MNDIACSPKSDKIGGFDKWKVRDSADTLIEAKEIENGDTKFYGVVLKEVKKIADAAMEAAAEKQRAAKDIALAKKVEKKMKKIYGG